MLVSKYNVTLCSLLLGLFQCRQPHNHLEARVWGGGPVGDSSTTLGIQTAVTILNAQCVCVWGVGGTSQYLNIEDQKEKNALCNIQYILYELKNISCIAREHNVK